jgi:hypothetical protein
MRAAIDFCIGRKLILSDFIISTLMNRPAGRMLQIRPAGSDVHPAPIPGGIATEEYWLARALRVLLTWLPASIP